ncbi:MAG: hypothetical protein FWF52_05645 [Candidatus Azobacteroides sp.]|nr:hypothetical protein [Candidatus Azobacteroides sp.]
MENAEINSGGVRLDHSAAKVKVKELAILKGIAKTVTNASLENYSTLPNNIIDAVFDSFEFKDTPGKRGWRLIDRALVKAMMTLLFETRYRYEEKDIDTKELDKQLNAALERNDYCLPPDFFQHPDKISFLKDIQPILKDYLGCFGLEEDEITNILIRFKTFFVLALREEWVNNVDYYKPLEKTIQSPFDTAVKREAEWERYYITLKKQTAACVFNEYFCLEQIYIPLRACYKQSKSTRENVWGKNRNETQNEKEFIIDLESYISDWIERSKGDDCIRIIHGGPGSGKSSFLKMFAAKLADRKQKVLYIPLYEYDVNIDFIAAVNQYFHTST